MASNSPRLSYSRLNQLVSFGSNCSNSVCWFANDLYAGVKEPGSRDEFNLELN